MNAEQEIVTIKLSFEPTWNINFLKQLGQWKTKRRAKAALQSADPAVTRSQAFIAAKRSRKSVPKK